MKKNDTIFAIIWLVLGLPLIGLSIAGLVDEFWSGMGSALVVIGACRLLRAHRLNKNEEYREKMETYATDERIHFLRTKAWSWAGYLFIIISAVAVIVFRILGQDVYSTAASYAVCLMLVLYWVCYLVLSKKY